MAFNWDRFIRLADKLIKNKNEESYRSAVSRAYYASYNRSLDFIEKYIEMKKLQVPESWGKSKHLYVAYRLGKTKDPLINNIARDLKDLFDDRKEADYKKDVQIKIPTAIVSIERAKKITEQLGKGYNPLIRKTSV